MSNQARVRLLQGVPLTPSYGDTFAFASRQAQTNYFLGKSKFYFPELMYIKNQPIYLPNQAGAYRDCDYLMYQNEDEPDKWYYGFITGVEYLANNTTMISWVQDEIQTWFFDFTFKPCFVEWEHPNTDTVGSNLMDAGLATGEYIINRYKTIWFNDWWLVVVTSVLFSDQSFPPAEGYVYGNVYSGVAYYCYDFDDINTLGVLLEALAGEGKSEAIISMYMVPKNIIQSTQASGRPMTEAAPPVSIAAPTSSTLDGYTPVNQKMYTYPYRALRITNSAGNSTVLRYEYMDSDFNVSYLGNPFPNGRIILYPTYYKGFARNYDEGISVGEFPQCSWLQDVYSNWLATQSVRWAYQQDRLEFKEDLQAATTGARGLLGVAGIAMGNYDKAPQVTAEAASSLVNQAIKSYGDHYLMKSSMNEEREVHSMTPPSFQGTIGNDSTLMVHNAYGFILEELTVTAEYARSIDNYFTLNGYPIKRVKTPNIYGRPSWNYVKTLGSVVSGSAPMYAKSLMQQLLDRGVRLWHVADLGNFSLSNSL